MNSTATSISPRRISHSTRGFTLLEILVVIAIMGFLAAMLYSGANLISEQQRRRITQQKMDEIRRAIVGDTDRFDQDGRRIIGGYVGDMEQWPDLFEAHPERRDLGDTTTPFDPLQSFDKDKFIRRPIGHFTRSDKRWVWDFPRRKLDNAADNSDHIGGLETENEGQPVGLWSDDPYGDGKPGGRLDNRWQGPYLVSPTDSMPEDSLGWPATIEDYHFKMSPERTGTGDVHLWVDGDNRNDREAFDEKENFRLKQTDGRLEDGWNRALRFFISEDYSRPGSNATIFWIISEGPDKKAIFPTKGKVSDSASNDGGWSVDGNDRMGVKFDPDASPAGGYNPDAPENRDNIVMQLYSHEWQSVFAEINARKKRQTEELFAAIRRAMVGGATPGERGINNGYTGTLCRWPQLFRWETPSSAGEAGFWDDQNEETPSAAYSKGQPRGLWSASPNTGSDAAAVAADRLAAPTQTSLGVGWVGPYLIPPMADGNDNLLRDGWGREVLFFLTKDDQEMVVISRGADGRFNFGEVDTTTQEPKNFTEKIDTTTSPYDATEESNKDNVVMVIKKSSWQPARFTLECTVLNADNTIKVMVGHGVGASGSIINKVIPSPGTPLTDIDGDGTADDKQITVSLPENSMATSGMGRIVFWKDTTPGTPDNRPGPAEKYTTLPVSLFVHETRREITLDASEIKTSWPSP